MIFQLAQLTPVQIAGMDKLTIIHQDDIKSQFGQPLVPSKAYYLLRDATANFTKPGSEAAMRLDASLYSLLVKKGMFDKAETQKNPLAEQFAKAGANAAKRKVSFSDFPLAAKFMPRHQKQLVQGYPDEDKEQILSGIEKNLKKLGDYRSQDGLGDKAMVYAHYFYGQTDQFITETDFKDGNEFLFGFTILNGDTRFAELGAISLEELVENKKIELDFYWEPVTLGEAKANAYPSEWGTTEAKQNEDYDADMTDIKGAPIKPGDRVVIEGLDRIEVSDGTHEVSPYNEMFGTVRNAQPSDIDVDLDGSFGSLGFYPSNIRVLYPGDKGYENNTDWVNTGGFRSWRPQMAEDFLEKLKSISPIKVPYGVEQSTFYEEGERNNDHVGNLVRLALWGKDVPQVVSDALSYLRLRMDEEDGISGNARELNDRLNQILRPAPDEQSVVAKYIRIGFSDPNNYNPDAWKEVKQIMDWLVKNTDYVIEKDSEIGKYQMVDAISFADLANIYLNGHEKNATKDWILGRKTTILLPNGEKHNAKYAIVSLKDIIASHDEKTFSDSLGYPLNQLGRNLNDRNYASDKGAQQLVAEYARDLKPELLVSTSRTPEGTPIITPEGIVVSGNNRTMSLKLAASEYPVKFAEYKHFLLEELETFGFDVDDDAYLENFNWAPVLVRIDYDFGEMTTTNMAKYNASSMKSKSPVDAAIELATTIREQPLCESGLPEIFGEFDTLSEFYADRAAVKRMVEKMQQCSILNQQDLPRYIDAGFFTEDGKAQLETLLASIVLDPDTLRVASRDGVRAFRQAVVNALPVLIQNKNLGDASLVKYINEAIRYQGELAASKLSFQDFIGQAKLFTEHQVSYQYQALYLNRLMESGQRKFREALRKYNASQSAASAGGALFESEVVTPGQAFEGYIMSAVPESDAKLIQRFTVIQPGSSPLLFSGGEMAVFSNNRQEEWEGQEVKIIIAKQQLPANEYTVKLNDGSELDVTELDLKKIPQVSDLSLAKTRLKLLTKALPHLKDDEKQLASTRIKLLTKYLEKSAD